MWHLVTGVVLVLAFVPAVSILSIVVPAPAFVVPGDDDDVPATYDSASYFNTFYYLYFLEPRPLLVHMYL